MSEIVKKIQESTDQLTAEGSPWAVDKIDINGVTYKHYPAAPKSISEFGYLCRHQT